MKKELSHKRTRETVRLNDNVTHWNDGSLGTAVVEEIDNRLTALIERDA